MKSRALAGLLEGMLEEMRIPKALGGDGVVYFSSSSLREPFLEALKNH